MNPCELGRLDAWYGRGARNEEPDYQTGYQIGSEHREQVRAWVRAHPGQSQVLDGDVNLRGRR